MAKSARVRDLTNVQAVHSVRLRTIQVKVHMALAASSEIELLTIASIADVQQVLDIVFANLDEDQEHFVILVLNAAHELVGYKVIASGVQDHVYVDPKLVFRNALLLGAHSIILAHNHPDKTSEPSSHDIALTGKLLLGGSLLQIDVLDHVIYTRKARVSLRQRMPHLFGDSDAPDSP